MRLDRGRTVEALACADRWSADTVDGVADLPWAAAVTGGQARRWLAALYDLGWRPPDREPGTTEALGAAGARRQEDGDVPVPAVGLAGLVRGLRFDAAAYRPPIDGRRWR